MTEIIIKSIGESDEAVVLGTIKWVDKRLELTTVRDEEARQELLRFLERLSGRKLLLRLPCTRETTDKGTTHTSRAVFLSADHPLYPWAVTAGLDILGFRLSNGKFIWGVIKDPVPVEFLPTPA